MSAIGPDLPPHLLAKRKRQEEDAKQNEVSTTSGAKRRSSSPESQDKRRKVMGPAMPPAPIDQMPTNGRHLQTEESDDSEDDDDDDLGPAPPPPAGSTETFATQNGYTQDEEDDSSSQTDTPALKRDEWMTMAPKQDDLAARMDPTKQRARGFNTGKGARGPAPRGEDAAAWNETPEQKRKRLADELMGVTKTTLSTTPREERRSGNVVTKSQGPSLLEQHQQGKGPDLDDDPSQRAFDREKDMASGGQISASKRREMLNRAGDFSSRFSSGGLL